MSPRKIIFIYADPPGFSGQRSAAEIVAKGCQARGDTCEILKVPTANRIGGQKITWVFGFAWGLWLIIWAALRQRFMGPALVYLTCGQTLTGLIRDGLPFVVIQLFKKKRSILSLHGSNFTRWEKSSVKAYLLRALIAQSQIVTVLGNSQKKALLNLQVPECKIRVVPNTCTIEVLSDEFVTQKQMLPESEPLKILYLSSLIKSKGYPLFLESLERLAQTPGRCIEAVLCGSIIISEYQDFPSVEVATEWIEAKINRINASQRCHVRWVKGAYGEEKTAMFEEAQLFVFPTLYPVEAQPLVLLEAMASGGAIITSQIGEISTILNQSDAVLLTDVSVDSVSAAIDQLIQNDDERLQSALRCKHRFEREFALAPHLDLWAKLFSEVS